MDVYPCIFKLFTNGNKKISSSELHSSNAAKDVLILLLNVNRT